MFDAISRFFSEPKNDKSTPTDTKLAVAALLVHLANVDGETTEEEQETIALALKEHFDLEKGSVRDLLAEAKRQDAAAVDFYHFTSVLSDLPEDERVEIIRMMWQVVFADNENHELEDNMVWRVAELIHVPARRRAILRNQMKS